MMAMLVDLLRNGDRQDPVHIDDAGWVMNTDLYNYDQRITQDKVNAMVASDVDNKLLIIEQKSRQIDQSGSSTSTSFAI